MGFNGTRIANSTSADQPVASAIGTSGVSARRHDRKATNSTTADRQQAEDQQQQAPPGRRHRGVGVGRQHRQAGELRVDALGRMQLGAHRCRCTCFWRSSGISRMPNAIVAVLRSR